MAGGPAPPLVRGPAPAPYFRPVAEHQE